MNKVIEKKGLCLLPVMFFLQVLLQPANASAVECTEKPLTRLESSICGDPALRALDSELTASLLRAVDGGLVGKVQAQRIRNGIARKCRHEPAAKLPRCLLKGEVIAFERIAMRLGEYQHEVRQSLVGQLVEKPQLLQRQLILAQSSLNVTGDASLTVTTIVELMKIAPELSPTGSSALSENSTITAVPTVARLQQLLTEGCQHPRYAASWKTAVQANGLRCNDLNSSTTLYSSSDYD